MGDVDSVCNKAIEKCQMLMNQNQQIWSAYARHSDKHRSDYQAHILAAIDGIRFLLKQGFAFHGHDESEDLRNCEIPHFLPNHNEDINVVIFI